MAKIHKLSPVLSNQIAAGEVVERPASVVKELVENSIDAKSREIDVTVKGSGLDQIKVVDDGTGIERDDVRLAFHRHATSKIHDRRDLFQVTSLGFRGEALPSIASVADVVLRTSTGGVGTQIKINGGRLIGVQPAAARRGTSVTVSDLFFNTPARLKYMKSPATELSRITDIVDRLALGHPKIAFSLVHNHREILRTAGRGNLQQVIGSIYGINQIKSMLPIANHNPDFKIWGYVSLPKLTRASRNYVSLILNGRYVRELAVTKAIIEGYGSKLMVGRYPIAIINVQADPILVDPNVHPTKQTVRISKERSLCRLITSTIAAKLAKQNLIPDAVHERGVKPQYNVDQINLDLNRASTHYGESAAPVFKRSRSLISTNRRVHPVIIKNRADLNSLSVRKFRRTYRQADSRLPFGRNSVTFQPSQKLKKRERSVQLANDQTNRRFPRLRYIGQMHGTYLLCEAADGMYILDQHAAQERVNYEKFRQAIGKVSPDEQDLLVPIVLNYSSADAFRIRDRLDVLKSVGVNLAPFGENSFVVRQHPTWFEAGQEKATICEMIDWVLKNGRLSIAKFRAKTAIMMSCKRAIKANQHLNRQQAIHLIRNLSRTEDPFNCPHGRPVLVHFSNYEMQKMFKRIQDPHRAGPWKQYLWKKSGN